MARKSLLLLIIIRFDSYLLLLKYFTLLLLLNEHWYLAPNALQKCVEKLLIDLILNWRYWMQQEVFHGHHVDNCWR